MWARAHAHDAKVVQENCRKQNQLRTTLPFSLWQNGGNDRGNAWSLCQNYRKEVGWPPFSTQIGQVEERNFPLSGLYCKGKHKLELFLQILSTLAIFYRLFLLVVSKKNNGTRSFVHLTMILNNYPLYPRY